MATEGKEETTGE